MAEAEAMYVTLPKDTAVGTGTPGKAGALQANGGVRDFSLDNRVPANKPFLPGSSRRP